jgi:hypothetical protein
VPRKKKTRWGQSSGLLSQPSISASAATKFAKFYALPRTGASTARLIISIWIDSFELQITLAVGLANSFPKPRHAVTPLGKS